MAAGNAPPNGFTMQGSGCPDGEGDDDARSRIFLAGIAGPGAGAPAGLAGELRIAAWNLEHLDDSDGEGCVGRKSADYAALARRIADLGAVVVAFQEVENAAAAHRVFPASDWHVEMSGRPPKVRSRACWDKREARLGHLATGFAIRRGLEYRPTSPLTKSGASDSV